MERVLIKGWENTSIMVNFQKVYFREREISTC